MNFLEKYNNKKNIRFSFFKKTLNIAKERNFKTIVETGTSRGKKKFLFFARHLDKRSLQRAGSGFRSVPSVQ